MAAPIGPGDWVEKFREPEVPGQGIHLPVGFVGRVVRITQCLACGHVVDALELASVYSLLPHRAGKLALLLASAYRPIYRPKAVLIESLKSAPICIREDA